MAIPKIIHMCWFGRGSMSTRIRSCVRSIEALANEGYTVNLWNESNYDVGRHACVKKAYEQKKWSLVSNYVRLDVLREHGGIYLDTDIEVVKPFDDLLASRFLIGFMWDCTLGTAVIGAAPNHPIVNGILGQYDTLPGFFKSPNNDTFTDYFLEHVAGFALNGRAQTLEDVRVLDKHAFEHPSLFKRENYTIHHFEQSWKANSGAKVAAKALIIKLCSLWLYRKYVCWKSLRISPYYAIYRRTVDAALAAQPARPANGVESSLEARVQ